MPQVGIADFVWGPITVSAATVVLAVASTVGGSDRPWPWIIGSAGFIVLHTIVSHSREQSIVRRLGRDYDRVQRRIVQVISDLGELAKYDLWMVDVYVPAWRWNFTIHRPFLKRSQELRRELSVSLIDSRPQPPTVDVMSGPHGECFRRVAPLLWFDPSHQSATENLWTSYDEAVNSNLTLSYGVLSLSPLVDQLGKHCHGVLAVHVQPEPNVALQAIGALRSQQGKRRLHNACVDLNGLLSR